MLHFSEESRVLNPFSKCKRGVLVLFFCLWLCGCQQNYRSLSLTTELPRANQSLILSSSHLIGGSYSLPFISHPNDQQRPTKDKVWELEPGADFFVRFNLKQAVPLKLIVQGSTKALEGSEGQVLLNGRPVGPLRFRDEQTTLQFELSESDVHEGENKIGISTSVPIILRKAYVEALHRSQETHAQVRDDEILLPYGTSLEYPIELDGKNRSLIVDALSEWNVHGTPDAIFSPELSIRVQSDDPPYDGLEMATVGDDVSLAIPDNLQKFTVSLTALAREKPLIGQSGLGLQGARLAFVSEKTDDLDAPKESLAVKPFLPEKARPNVIVYMIDTLRADHLSCYGYHRRTSPHIDKFAKDAFLFEDASAQSPWTKPSTATVLTGLHPKDHGAQDYGDMLNADVKTLAERLNDKGYISRAWVANGFASGKFGVTRGFKSLYCPKFVSEKIHALVVSWFDKSDKQEPFFLYIHAVDPHAPYSPPEAFNKWCKSRDSASDQMLARVSRIREFDEEGNLIEPKITTDLIDLYDGEILSNDASFGKLIAELKSRGVYDDSIIVLVSDHGEEFFEHSGFGHASSLYQELIHIPLIIKFPQQVGAGTRVKGEWQHLDVVPTILRALGQEIPKELKGLAFDPHAPQSPTDRNILLHANLGPDSEKFQQSPEPFHLHMEGLRKSGKVYVEQYRHRRTVAQPRMFFDLNSDPGQKFNRLFEDSTLGSFYESSLRQSIRAKKSANSTDASDRATLEVLESLQYL